MDWKNSSQSWKMCVLWIAIFSFLIGTLLAELFHQGNHDAWWIIPFIFFDGVMLSAHYFILKERINYITEGNHE